MLIIARDRDYPDLLDAVRGKRVLIWTCNTCARLCNGIGGRDAAGRLSEMLLKDGVDVAGVMSTSASCLDMKVAEKCDDIVSSDADVILALTCDIGSDRVSSVSGMPAINPIETFGYGYLSADGVPTAIVNGEHIPVGRLSSRTSPY